MKETIYMLLPYILPIVSGVLGWMGRTILMEHKEQKMLKTAVIAILHDRIYRLCQLYIKDGKITVSALHNMKYLYESYAALGGNGTGTELYNRCLELNLINKEEDLK